MTDLLIIGGGASGMAAAISAAELGDQVVVLERMDRVGKKLLATGNGRCNLMNRGALRYPGGADFAARVLNQCGAVEQTRFWSRLGLQLREEDDGRVYPACGQASVVLDTLRFAMERLGVTVYTGMQVQDIRPLQSGGWQATAGSEAFTAKRILIAGGGRAQEKLGSNGSCLSLCKKLKLPVSSTWPALTQLETDTAPIRGLSGIRCKGSVQVVLDGEVQHEEHGEILFTDYGISGVCAMQCARYVTPTHTLRLNLLAGMGFSSADALEAELQRRLSLWQDMPAEQLMLGLCVPRLALCLMTEAGIRCRDKHIRDVTVHQVKALSAICSGLTLSVKGIKGFDSAQVTSGGVSTDVFYSSTMQCTVMPGLYAAGEVLDVDGDCGGFNLLFAFGSGILAGRNGRREPR